MTAFEPSGDALAAPVVAELRERAPGLAVHALGGPLMEAAGATLIERTVDDAAMGTSAWRKVRVVRSQIQQALTFCRARPVKLHVPVDSPAANFPLCRVLRREGIRTIHLAAPQVWAWGRRRIRKLRKRTDLVLCLLPFEEQWFNDRDVPARFIGHPAINRDLDEAALTEQARELPQGNPKVALFPGSRTQEVQANLKLLLNAYVELQSRHASMSGLVVAASPELAELVRRRIKVFPTGLHMITGRSDTVISWCDLAIAVSGTVTLHIARQMRPMIGVYKTGPLGMLLSKLILRTPYRLLPNIVAEREIVPEFVPHAGGAAPVVREAARILQDSKIAAIQAESLRRVCLRFANKQPAREAAGYIIKMMKGKVVGS
jgi:lipid-A-disaccharide synthase